MLKPRCTICKNSKGKKDRIAPLSLKILELLREYYQIYKPLTYLFEGQIKGVQLGPYRYHADGIIYFGQWKVTSILVRMEHPMEKESYISLMVLCSKEGSSMVQALEKEDWLAEMEIITKEMLPQM